MKSAIVEVLEGLASYYRTSLSPTQFAMYAEDLSGLTPAELVHACREYRRNPQNKFFPLPSALVAIVRPVETELDLGNDVASRVIGSVSKFGSYRGSEARAYIGEIGWECVQRFGGWVTICSELNDETKTSIFAQLRGLAQTVAKKGANGTLDQPANFANQIGAGEVNSLIQGSINRKKLIG
jgi:hypothetical protein